MFFFLIRHQLLVCVCHVMSLAFDLILKFFRKFCWFTVGRYKPSTYWASWFIIIWLFMDVWSQGHCWNVSFLWRDKFMVVTSSTYSPLSKYFKFDHPSRLCNLVRLCCRKIVEDVPRGVHINFLKAERSLHRWALEDIRRIHAAEELAVEEGGGVEMHVLEDAGHWVWFFLG